MATGVVKAWYEAKGFGFVVPDDGGADVFVHASGLRMNGYRTLVEGERVSFDIVPDRKDRTRSRGINVIVIGGEVQSERAVDPYTYRHRE